MLDPAPERIRGIRLSIVGLLVNAALTMVKLFAGIVGNSYALVADAIESMADIFGSIVVWRGMTVASQPPDADHPYGHGKAEALSAAVVSILLFGAAIGIAIEAVREILVPHHVPSAFTLWVLLGVIAIKETLFRIGRRAATDAESAALMADAWHHRSDAITSAAAFVGITVALIGGKAYAPADDWAALFAAMIIFVNAFRLVRPQLNELMDRVPPVIIERARQTAAAVPGVRAVEKAFARRTGSRYWVDMHIEVDADLTVLKAHGLAHDVKDAIRAAIPEVHDAMIHVEPFGGVRAV